jgi:opacity protein-like surface antigen
MKRKLIAILLTFCISELLFSQSELKSGYVVTNTDEKIEGLIDNRSNTSNCVSCYFKKDSLAKVIEYLPNQIKAYRFYESKYYVSKYVKLNSKVDTVFLECLLSGKVILWRYSSVNEMRYFIEKDSILIEVENNDVNYVYSRDGIKYTKSNTDRTQYVRKSKKYLGVLKSAFSDCPEMFSKVDKMDFNQKSLIKISKTYHEKVCKDEPCIIYEKPLSKRKYNFGIEYNYIFPTLNYYSTEQKVLFSSTPDSRFSIGVFGATNIDYDHRFMFQVNVKYLFQSYSDSGSLRNLYPASYKYEFTSVLSDITVKYRLKLTKFKPYFWGGLTIGYILNDQYNINTKMHLYITDANKEKSLFGIKAGMGVEYSVTSKVNIFLSLNYDYDKTLYTLQIYGFALSTGLYF